MGYCSEQDLINAFGELEIIQLTDRANAGVIDDIVLNHAISKADVEINMWLAGSYTLPLFTTPPLLTHIACDLTRYYLSIDISDDHPTAMRYRDARKNLQSIARGDASLGLDQSDVPTTRVDLVQISAGRNDFADRSSW
jgi:phage gp36-like protein